MVKIKICFLKIVISLLAVTFLFDIFNANTYAYKLSTNSSNEDMIFLLNTYDEYLQKYSDKKYANNQIEIYTDYVDKFSDDVEIKKGIGDYNGECVITGGVSSVEWNFDVEEEGFYSIEVEYYPIVGRGINIERILQIDGKIPFREASSIVFRRRWVDKEPIAVNPDGNDAAPVQIQDPIWMSQYIYMILQVIILSL